MANQRYGFFFKSIESDNLDDPGKQLEKVIKFKKEVTEKKELLYKEFVNEVDWRDTIHDSLLTYVLDLSSSSKETSPVMATGSKENVQPLDPGKDSKKETSSYPPELQLLIQKASKQIESNVEGELEFWDKTRFFLLASAWFSKSHNDERLGVHEINLVYTMRGKWTLALEEKELIFKTMVSDSYETRPGWFWFRNLKYNNIGQVLGWLSYSDNNSNVRKCAFNMMSLVGYYPGADVVKQGLLDNEKDVVTEVIKLLAKHGSAEDAIQLDIESDEVDIDIKKAAFAAKLDIMFRDSPIDALREYTLAGGNTPIFIREFNNKCKALDCSDLLIEALDSPHSEVRRFAMTSLRIRDELKIEDAKKFVDDADVEIRKDALLTLVNGGEKITTAQLRKIFPLKNTPKRSCWAGLLRGVGDYDYQSQAIRDEFYLPMLKQTPTDEILSQIETYGSNTEVAYEYLAVNHYDLIEDKLRDDLDTGFKDIADDLRNSKWENDIIEFVLGKMIKAALAGLVKHGTESDIKYARKYLGKTRHNTADTEALCLMDKYGDETDLVKILEVANTSSYITQRTAYKTAMHLSTDKVAVLQLMLKKGDGQLARESAEKLQEMKLKEIVIRAAEKMLDDDLEEKRLIGTAILVETLNNSEMEVTLDQYTAKDRYYYDVVTWFDRVLYAPGRYGDVYKSTLLAKLKH